MSLTDSYFKRLNDRLKLHDRAIPFLMLDLDILDQNMALLKEDLNSRAAFRIVVKSLPCQQLIEYIMQHAGTQRLMVFHQPFLTDLAKRLDRKASILLGKPMPVKTAEFFFRNLPYSKKFDPFQQIQWLVDSEKRIQEYINLAKRLENPLRLNLEIDVGLHRGGFSTLKQLSAGLSLLQANQEHVVFSGFMGYDAHVTKLPKMLRSQNRALFLANQFYNKCKAMVKEIFPELWNAELTFNGAGSPTLQLHKNDSPLNDISAGSCLVKPTTFDIPNLKAYQPASFIATPVLKSFSNTTLPAIEGMKGILNLLNSSNRQSLFIYGGYWKADYFYPRKLRQNGVFEASTNQTMLNAPITVNLEVDDFVFLRPHQSEFVFLQFGDLLIIRDGKIIDTWAVLNN